MIFTSATIVTSAILFRGFRGTPASITTVVMGFLQICSGVVLLQLSKSSKNVPDTEIFRGDLDQIRTVAEQSEPESEPKADAIRGTAAIIRRISVARRTAEADEARKIHEERQRDLRTPLSTNETVEWDGVKRRVTWTSENGRSGRRNTLSGQHPPLGMARIPDEEEAREDHPAGRRRSMSVDEAMRLRVYGREPDEEEPHPESFLGRVRGLLNPKRSKASLREPSDLAAIVPHRDLRDVNSPIPTMPGARPRVYSDATLPSNIHSSTASQSSPRVNHITFAGDVATEMKTYDFAAAPISAPGYQRTTSRDGSEYQSVPGGGRLAVPEPPMAPSGGGKSKDKDSLRPDSRHSARRQFSFQFLHRHAHGRSESQGSVESEGGGRHSLGWKQKLPVGGSKTEEERLGLVKGDSVSTVQETLRSDSPTSMEKEGSVKTVPRGDDIPSGEWNEKWDSRRT